MARKKTNNFIEVFKLFFGSIKTYFMYLDQTAKALAFPLLGQLISIIVICAITHFMCTNILDLREKFAFLSSDSAFLTTLWILLLPFFIVFIKAFYDYIILFASLNLVFYTNSHKKKIKNIDFESCNNVIKRRLFKYIILMLLTIPFLAIAPFLSLVFQIFAMENDISPLGAIKRSISMVKSNFVPTVIMLILCFIVTYEFLPSMFIWAAEKISLYSFLVGRCENLLSLIPIQEYASQFDLGMLNESINEIFSPLPIAKSMAKMPVSFIVIGFTLPLRCCCFTELYRLFDAKNIKENSKMTDEIVKRATSKK